MSAYVSCALLLKKSTTLNKCYNGRECVIESHKSQKHVLGFSLIASKCLYTQIIQLTHEGGVMRVWLAQYLDCCPCYFTFWKPVFSFVSLMNFRKNKP